MRRPVPSSPLFTDPMTLVEATRAMEDMYVRATPSVRIGTLESDHASQLTVRSPLRENGVTRAETGTARAAMVTTLPGTQRIATAPSLTAVSLSEAIDDAHYNSLWGALPSAAFGGDAPVGGVSPLGGSSSSLPVQGMLGGDCGSGAFDGQASTCTHLSLPKRSSNRRSSYANFGLNLR